MKINPRYSYYKKTGKSVDIFRRGLLETDLEVKEWVACVNTNRNFIGMELDETYFNIAKERIEKHLQKLKKKRGNDNEFKES